MAVFDADQQPTLINDARRAALNAGGDDFRGGCSTCCHRPRSLDVCAGESLTVRSGLRQVGITMAVCDHEGPCSSRSGSLGIEKHL